MLLADGAIGTGDRRLDVAQHGVGPLEGGMAGGPATRAGRERDVPAAGVGNAAKAFEPVGEDGGAFGDDFLGHALHPLSLEAGDAAQLDPPGAAILRGLNRHDNRLLARAAAPRLAARVLTTEIGIIHLDPAIEPHALAGDAHDLGELGLDLPGRRLRDAEPAAELNRADPLLGLGDQIHGAEPSRQRHLGGVEIVPAVSEVCRRQALH